MITTPTGSPLFAGAIDAMAQELSCAIAALPLADRVEALNRVRRALHEVSPFASEPVDCVQWVPADRIAGNDYNPNRVAPPEMRLLERSIREDGYTQPVVGWQNGDSEGVTIVDGFHRSRVGRECKPVRARLHGYLPVTLIKTHRGQKRDRIAATIRHNRARGVHGVLPMADIVADLLREGWADDEVATELGMDADEVLRFKQTVGLPELFSKRDYSRAWVATNDQKAEEPI